jgi:hypothetical protein
MWHVRLYYTQIGSALQFGESQAALASEQHCFRVPNEFARQTFILFHVVGFVATCGVQLLRMLAFATCTNPTPSILYNNSVG